MNAIQENALKFKALYEVAKAQPITDENCEARILATELWIETKRRLFAWVRECMATDPSTAKQFGVHKADIDRLFENARRFPKIDAALVDLCFRLNVEGR